MRTLLFLLFIQLNFLVAQTESQVYPDHLYTAEHVVVDSLDHNFYVTRFSERADSYWPFIAAYTAAGERIWEYLPTQSDGPLLDRLEGGTTLIDLNQNQLLFVGLPGNNCDFPYADLSAIVLNKNTGEVVTEQSLDLDNFDFFHQAPLRWSLSPDREQLLVFYLGEVITFTALSTDMQVSSFTPHEPAAALAYLDNQRIFYAGQHNDSTFYHTENLVSGASTAVTMPRVLDFIEAKQINEQQFFRTADSCYRYLPATNELIPVFALAESANMKLKADHIFVFDPASNVYFSYYPAEDSLTMNQQVNLGGNRVSDLEITPNGRYLVGRHQFASHLVPGFGYWLFQPSQSAAITNEENISIDTLLVDTVLNFRVVSPNFDLGFYYEGHASASLVYRLKVRNEGSVPINRITVEFPTNETFQCGPVASVTHARAVPTIAPGETYTLTDTVIRSRAYRPDGIYRFGLDLCIGRPNDELDLVSTDQCATAFSGELLPPPKSFVSGSYLINHTKSLPDTITGGQYLYGDQIVTEGFGQFTPPNGNVTALNADGSVRWEITLPNIFWQDGEAGLIDAGPDYLLALKGLSFTCSMPVLGDPVIYRIRRSDGAMEEVYRSGILGGPPAPLDVVVSYLQPVVDAAGEQLYFIAEDTLYRWPIGSDETETEALLATIWDNQPTNFPNLELSWNGDQLLIWSVDQVTLFDPESEAVARFTLPAAASDIISSSDAVYLLIDGALQRLNPDDGILTSLLTLSEDHRFGYADEGLLLFDEAHESYARYLPEDELFGPEVFVDLPVYKTKGAHLFRGRILLYGEAQPLPDIPFSRRHGFAFHFPLDSGPTSDYDAPDLEVSNMSLDGIEVVDTFGQDMTGGQVYVSWIQISFDVTNLGNQNVDRFTVIPELPVRGLCGFNDNNFHRFLVVDSLFLAPGDQDRFTVRYREYLTDVIDGGLDVERRIVVNFPNDQLEADLSNNVGIVLLTPTEELDRSRINFSVSPNPSSDYWVVSGLPSGDFDWALYDLTGRVIQQGTHENVLGSDLEISALNVKTGLYLLRVGSGVVKVMKR